MQTTDDATRRVSHLEEAESFEFHLGMKHDKEGSESSAARPHGREQQRCLNLGIHGEGCPWNALRAMRMRLQSTPLTQIDPSRSTEHPSQVHNPKASPSKVHIIQVH